MGKKPETIEDVVASVARLDDYVTQSAAELNDQDARLTSVEDLLTKATTREVPPMAQRFEDFFKTPPRTGVTDKAPTVQYRIRKAMDFARLLSNRMGFKRKLRPEDMEI